jgi:hypothetical protein
MSEPPLIPMTCTVADPIFKKLTAELARAEASVLNVLKDSPGKPPAALLVVFKRRYEFRPGAYLLYDPDNLEISVMVDLREGLRVAASKVAQMQAAQPAYAISMIAMDSDELSFWVEKGFFPKQEIPASFVGKELLLFTASNASGQVIRRLSELVSSPVLLAEGTRQLGRSVQVQLSHEACEMDVFWSKHQAVRKQLLEHAERRHYL